MIESDNHVDIDLRSLRALVAVADQGSFRGAAPRGARRVLGEVQTLGADVQAAVTGERQTLRIGTFQTGTTELLPPALRTLREERPDVEVQLAEIRTNTQTYDH